MRVAAELPFINSLLSRFWLAQTAAIHTKEAAL
jgi:hypothetical protein